MGSRLAACNAAGKGARVALIAPTWHANDVAETLLQRLQTQRPIISSASWSGLADGASGHIFSPSRLTPMGLRTLGIDVVQEPVRFTPQLTLMLENRYLKASRYLLTDGYGSFIPNVAQDGLPCHQLTQLKTIPQHIAVIGSGATAVEWAYALSCVATVTLILPGRSLLPSEDSDIQRLSEVQLKHMGITIVAAEDCLGSGSSPIEAQQVNADLLVVVPQTYGWESLRLENVGLTPGHTTIPVNRYLQTSCPQIYVSGGSLGGENRPELTQQETAIALENALFGRRHSVNYGQMFYSIHLLSPIGRWGLTERQARERHGHDVQIFKAACLPMIADQVAQTNFCKIITLGVQILGLHLMGDGAPALVSNLGDGPTVPTLSQGIAARVKPGTLTDAIHQSIEQWHGSRWCEGQWRRDWAENWFNFRRSV